MNLVGASERGFGDFGEADVLDLTLTSCRRIQIGMKDGTTERGSMLTS